MRFATLMPTMRAAKDLLTAVGYLAWARHQLAKLAPSTLARRESGSDTALSPWEIEQASRVGLALSRAGSRVPWRSDCLVQALAAERWLGTLGVPTVLCIGTRKDEQSQYHFHAWVMAGTQVVTGGEIGAYAPLLGARDTRGGSE